MKDTPASERFGALAQTHGLASFLSTLLIALALCAPNLASADARNGNPDLTNGGDQYSDPSRPGDYRHNDEWSWNLGPTGMSGWMYRDDWFKKYEGWNTEFARQIEVTSVDAGSPAEGILQVGDVILGADGTGAEPADFTYDARKAFAAAISEAEARDPAILKMKRWRGTGETSTIQAVADVSGSLDGKYFTLHDGLGTVAVWFDVDNSGTAIPSGASAADRAIEISSVVTGDAATSVAAAIGAALDFDAGFTASVSTDTVTVASDTGGDRTDISDGDTGFTFAVAQQGSSSVDTVSITLETLGAYSATAPYNCPKSAAVLEKGLDAIMAVGATDSTKFSLVTLLAGNDPTNPDNAARMTRVQQEIQELILTPEEVEYFMSNDFLIDNIGGKIAWSHGFKLIALAEYYLQTGDSAAYDSMRAYAVAAANGQSMFGTSGHKFTLPAEDGSLNGPYGIGYGVVNSANMQCFYGLLLAREAGVTDQRVLDAIERASNFYGAYVNRGSIPYGEHNPGYGHGENGKNAIAALCYKLQGGHNDFANYYSMMAGASATNIDSGHSGPYLNYLWAALGANAGGEESMAAFFEEQRWFYDLARNHDGTFTYNSYQNGGQFGYGGDDWSALKLQMYTACLLPYAAPLRQTYVTGKNTTDDPSTWLTAQELADVDNAISYDATTRTTNELLDDLGSVHPFTRGDAAAELGLRTSEHAAILPGLESIAADTNASLHDRMGACEALGAIENQGSLSLLIGLLADSEDLVKYAAAKAIQKFPPEAKLPEVDSLMAACVAEAKPLMPVDTEDPIHLTHGAIAGILFGGYEGGILRNHDLVGINRDLLYPAIRSAVSNPQGRTRNWTTDIYASLTREDVEALSDVIVSGAWDEAPADRMFSGAVQVDSVEVLHKFGYSEGVPLAKETIRKETRDHKFIYAALELYGASSLSVIPDPKIVEFCQLKVASDDYATQAQSVLDAIAADTNPDVVVPLKGIHLMVADDASLTLPQDRTTLRAYAYNHVGAELSYAWRKVHGAGEVTFLRNGTNAAASTEVVFDGVPGEYLFEVTISDVWGLTEVSDTVAVTLNDTGGSLPANDPPTANNQSLAVDAGTPTQILLTGVDPEGNALIYTITSGPSQGRLTGTAPNLVYTADGNYSGTDSITFEVMDSEGQVTTGTIDITVNTAAGVGLAIYEPFDYAVGTLDGASGLTEVGLDGAWSMSHPYHFMESPTLTYSTLPSTGLRTYSEGGDNFGKSKANASRPIGAEALANRGLMDDGATLWFSAVMGNIDSSYQQRVNLALANGSLDKDADYIVDDGVDPGTGIGVTLYANEIQAAQFFDVNNSTVLKGSWDGSIAGEFNSNEQRLVVGKITWGASSDTVEIYLPVSGMVLPSEPSSTLIANVDQSKLDTLTFMTSSTGNGTTYIDEIRFGGTLHSVLQGTVDMTADTTAPTPNPMTFDIAPTPVDSQSITMVATPAFDLAEVEYYFTCTAGGGTDSGWQDSNVYTDTGLTPGTEYSYTVKARDRSPALNETAASAVASATISLQGTLPNVVGVEQSAAESLITDSDMTVGTITTATAYSQTVPAGHVLTQSPTGPASAAYGTPVDLEISIGQDPTLPTLASVDIVDDQGGGPVPSTSTIIYTLTFSEDMDLTTIEAADFVNLAALPISIGAISQPSPGVVTVEVSTTSTVDGYLVFSVAKGAVIKDAQGQDLNTSSAISDDTSINYYYAGNSAPVANDQAVTTDEDAPVAVTLSVSDIDGDPLTYTVVTAPANGVLSGTAPSLTYTPNTDYNGSDSFTFKANDGTEDSNTATVSITVNALNDAPVFTTDPIVAADAIMDQTYSNTIAGSATDAEGDALTYAKESGPSWLSVAADGALSGTPTSADEGPNSFTVSVSDGIAPLVTVTLNIEVTVPYVETTVVYESFDYAATGGTPEEAATLEGNSGGLGFGGSWVVDDDGGVAGVDDQSFEVLDPGLSLGTLPVAGNSAGRIATSYRGIAYRVLSAASQSALLADNSTTWFSVLYQDAGTGDDFAFVLGNQPHKATGSNPVLELAGDAFGFAAINSAIHAVRHDNSTSQTLSSTSLAANGGTYLLVGKINWKSVGTADEFYLFNVTDPDAAEPAEGTAFASQLGDFDQSTFSLITMWDRPNTSGVIDEIRFGESYASVVGQGGSGGNTVPMADDQSVTTDEGTTVAVTLTATDADSDPLTYSVVTAPTNGTLTGTAPDLTYTPDAGHNGSDSFTFKANDGTVDSNTATVSITVTAVNVAPVADDQSVTTDVDTAVGVTLTASDTDGDALTYSVVTAPTNGTLSGTAPHLNYTPNAGYSGSDSFTFKANDGTVDSNTATVSITVNPSANNAPVADSQSVTTDEDVALGITLTASDVDGDPLTYSVVAAPTNGVLSGTAPSLTYTPNTGYNGTDSFTFKANDGTVDSNTATVSITVNSVNDAPVFTADPIAGADATKDVAYSGTLDGSATDDDGDPLTYAKVSGPAWLSVASDGTLSGTPTSSDVGTNAFIVSVTDNVVASPIEATLNITVNDSQATIFGFEAESGLLGSYFDPAVTVAPDSGPLGDSYITTNTDNSSTTTQPIVEAATVSYTVNLPAGDYDLYARIQKPSSGGDDSMYTAVAFGDADPAVDADWLLTNGHTAFAPGMTAGDWGWTIVLDTLTSPGGTVTWEIGAREDGFNIDSFAFVAAGQDVGLTASGQSTILDDAVTGGSPPVVNNAPTWAVDPVNEVDATEDAAYSATLADDASDGDSDPLTFAKVSGPAWLSVAANGDLSGTPTNADVGANSFTVSVTDNIIATPVEATLNITVLNTNDAPVANDDSATTDEDSSVGITLTASDADVGDTLTYTVVSGPANGSLSGTAPNLTYTPNGDYNGSDSFTFKANDGTVDSNTATVSITVNATNDAPVANDDSAVTNEDASVAITLTGSDIDTGDTLTYAVVAGPTNGTLSGTAPNLTYTPNGDYNGSDSFTFKANDGTVDSNIATLSITVNAVNDAPIANNDSAVTNEDTGVAITLTGSDIDSGSLSYAVVTGPSNGTLSGTAPNLTYTPNGDYNGSDSFTFKANDGALDSNTATVSITVNAVNDAPVVNDNSATTDEDSAVAVTLTASDVDTGDTLTYAVVTGPTNGTLSGTAPNLTYTPNGDYNGSDSFTFQANDGTADSNTATISVTVNAVNDAPVANDDSATTNEDVAVAITLTASDVDTGDTLTYAVVAGPTNGTLSGTAPNLTFTPNTNYNGSDSFTFQANDGTVDSNIATVSITVNGVNNAPVANDDAVATNEDTSVAVTLTATDVDTGDTLTYAVVAAPTNGILTGTAPNLTYIPNSDYDGSDSFTFKANDGTVDSNTAAVSLTVNAVNDAPVADDQQVATTEDTAVAVTLTASDVEGDVLTYTVVTAPTNGTLSGTAPDLTYTPTAGYTGSDSFTFKANDGTVDSNTATVSITVNATGVAIIHESFGYDPAVGNDLSGEGPATGTSGTWGGDSRFDLVTGSLSYGNLATSGNSTQYIGSGGGGGNIGTAISGDLANAGLLNDSAELWFSVVVNFVDNGNDEAALTLGTDQPFTTDINNSGSGIGFYADSGGYVRAAIYSGGTQPGTHDATANFNGTTQLIIGKVTWGADATTADTVTLYNPGTDLDLTGHAFSTVSAVIDQSALDTIGIWIRNNDLAGDTFDEIRFGATYADVVPTGSGTGNTAPVADDQLVTTDEDTAVAVTLTGSDADGDALTYSVVTAPSNGALSGTAPDLTYTPNAGYNGSDSFTFVANDGTVDSNTATVSITVNAVNDAPVADDQSVSTNEDSSVAVTLTASDGEGDLLTYTVVTVPTNGTLSGTAPDLTYTPDANYSGSDSFTFKANDGSVDSNTATVSLMVNAVNDAPVADDQSLATDEDTDLAVTLTASDTDGDTLTYTVVTAPSNGVLSGTAPNLTYSPNSNYNGSDSFTFKANDGAVDSNTATVSITVVAVNDAPSFSSDPLSRSDATQGEAYSDTIGGSAGDVEGDSLAYAKVSGPAWLTVAADGLLSGTPSSTDVGPNSFTVSVSDGVAPAVTATLNIDVLSLVIEDYAYAEVLVASNSVSGGITDTFTSDNIYESITETEINGKPTDRYSYLEHKWEFDVAGGNSVSFHVEAHHSANGEGDNFVFAYSTTGENGVYSDMLTVIKTSDDNTEQTFTLPVGTSGVVHVRVRDADQSAGNRTFDTLNIDQMYILSQP
ncbi:hypothetical protein DDZ13_04070 [Coraliomargarita sinensis]|uniref:Uncharacterized protein n=1 Tax=Coraliomargarita sinensis TaxID=2174842 RepID=A0A317ZHU1_9BACT|nr:Ig-like domain-containing protein [Coraliomargarita sinensis]PXA05145.1 hypothetical protein DDZ13_04070 [Coraliomargarita sinensis]